MKTEPSLNPGSRPYIPTYISTRYSSSYTGPHDLFRMNCNTGKINSKSYDILQAISSL